MVNSNLLVMLGGIAIILAAIGVSSVSEEEKSFSQILTVGPVWTSDSWLCTSDSDFIVHGALRGLTGSLLEINVSNTGIQSLYAFEDGQMESFSIGASGSQNIIITRSGTITGFITIQTMSNANANCVPL